MKRTLLDMAKPMMKPDPTNPEWRIRVTMTATDIVYGDPQEGRARGRFLAAKAQFPDATVILERRKDADGAVSYVEIERRNGIPV